MAKHSLKVNDEVVFPPKGFQQLLDILIKDGYQTFGPTIFDGAIVLNEVKSISDLPLGWEDIQDAGVYRLEKNDSQNLFGYALGPHSWKKYLHPPEVQLWRAKRNHNGFEPIKEKQNAPNYAFLGVRPCELNAISLTDKIFDTKEFSDPIYKSRRTNLFIVAVNCTRPAGTCFCASIHTGPKAKFGFDIALTEVQLPEKNFFIAEVGSKKGIKIVSQINYRKAEKKELNFSRKALENAASQMGRSLDPSNLRSIFYENFEHPYWEKVAERCLTCGNCTMVCPTCFCYTVEDSNSLSGDHAHRRRMWDSCLTTNFSYIHGGVIRFSIKSRYRQWLTHKLSTCWDQFGTLGCVGCGRCITWCPVGIDITREANTILGENHSP
ncbi:4Fe-4S dicluster domain-containing protein [Thermodesulfobacteriota bacterium]